MIHDVIVSILGALQPSRWASSCLRRLAVAALTALGGAAIAPAVAQSSLTFAHPLVVAFVLLAPTLAIARLLPSVNVVVALVVGGAGAAVINAVVAQVMLSADAWSPLAGVIAVGVIAALLWLVPTAGRSTVSRGGQL